MVNYLKAIYETFLSMNPAIAAFFFVSSFLVTVFQYINGMWAKLLAKVATLTLSTGTASLAIDGMSFFNYFVPLTELFTFATGCAAAFAAAATIRIIKSFIPTIS
jgi:hypothetical protein